MNIPIRLSVEAENHAFMSSDISNVPEDLQVFRAIPTFADMEYVEKICRSLVEHHNVDVVVAAHYGTQMLRQTNRAYQN